MKFPGGKYGFKKISIKPNGDYSELLDYHLSVLRKVFEYSITKKVATSWPNTLKQSKPGKEVLAILQEIMKLEDQYSELMAELYDEDNEMMFIIQSEDDVKSVTDKLLNEAGIDIGKDNDSEFHD